jgi:hypothetical protein
LQTQIISTGDPVTSVSLQQIFESLSEPGILIGNELVVVSAGIVGVNPGTVLTDSGVFIIETEVKEVKQIPFTLTVSPQTYTVYYQYVLSSNFGGNPATLNIQNGLIEAEGFENGVVLGWIMYPGGSVPLNADSMFISAPRFRLGQAEIQNSNSYLTVYPPFSVQPTATQRIDLKWTQIGAAGPLSTVTTEYNSTYLAPITTVQNLTNQPLSETTWLMPFTVPILGLGRIAVELQVDSGALATITVVDVNGNTILPTVSNSFTNIAMINQVMPLPLNTGLIPGDEVFIKLAFSIQPANAVRIKSMGITSYNEPFNA